jgi:hypothetical protein
VLTDGAVREEDLAAVRDLAGAGVPVLRLDGSGTVKERLST